MSGHVRFGDFVLAPDSRELRRGSRTIPLSPKAYRLLEILVASRPKALSKMALQEHLWPDTFVVEKNLVNLVAEIRSALGDDPTHPRFVRTVNRFGYAFCEPTNDDPAGDSLASTRRDVRFRLVWADGRAGLGEGAYVLGRDPDLDLFLDSPGVSRRHARLKITGDEAILEDLGSKNGTFIADRRVDGPTRLGSGDVIRVGPVRLTFRAFHARESTRTEPQAEDDQS